MKQLLLQITALIFVSQSWAAPAGNGYRTESESDLGQECASCKQAQGRDSAYDAVLRFTQNMNEITDGLMDIAVISGEFDYAKECKQFSATSDGELREWGELITEEFSKPRCATVIDRGPRDIKRYCPNYQNMSPDERKALYVLLLTAMTHYESSCNYSKHRQGPNGIARGLLQLHDGKEQTYSTGCKKGDSRNAKRSLICGVAMICDQTSYYDKTLQNHCDKQSCRNQILFSDDAHWEVLQPHGPSQKAPKIQAALKKFSPCSVGGQRLGNAKRNKNSRVAQK
jgi:hypothetical protein